MKTSGKRQISTTMAFVRILSTLLKDKNLGDLAVPIVPDEARTFGMEGMFRQMGIYSSVGQRYTPLIRVDSYYKEAETGQILRGHQRGGRVLCLIGSGDVLQRVGFSYGALLHLLLHVWVSAHWRPRP